MTSIRRTSRWLAAGLAVAALLAACGSDAKSTSSTAAPAASTTAAAAATGDTAAATGDTAAATGDTTAPSDTAAASGDTAAPAAGEGIVIAVNSWTGSAVNANVAKVVLESQLNTKVDLLDIDENATWVGMDNGSIDASLEVWPSGHVADYETYIKGKASIVDMGKLGVSAKIGWYVPTFVVKEHPELATWEGFKDPALAGLFATAESGDLGQFLMGDPSWVTYDEQIIANLGLKLKFVVGGSEAALLAAIDQSIADHKPVLLQFWRPHWKLLEADLTEVKLPDVTDACTASAAAADGTYACDYPADELYKVAAATLEKKNPTAWAFISKFQLSLEQQSEIAGYVDRDGMTPLDAAQKWVDANPDVVAGWMP